MMHSLFLALLFVFFFSCFSLVFLFSFSSFSLLFLPPFSDSAACPKIRINSALLTKLSSIMMWSESHFVLLGPKSAVFMTIGSKKKATKTLSQKKNLAIISVISVYFLYLLEGKLPNNFPKKRPKQTQRVCPDLKSLQLGPLHPLLGRQQELRGEVKRCCCRYTPEN